MSQWAYANYSAVEETRYQMNRARTYSMSDGPWYESAGPCSPQVRDDVYNKYFKGKNNSDKRSIDIQNILIDIIPNHRNDFGSYRGYATWGKELHHRIKMEFAKCYAQTHRSKRIRDNFIKDWIVDRLYRFPDGLRVQKLKKEFYDNA
tara:strand:+ start:256 stop:699 length:444 start_codon:yes stop_codon:yes gene_type:complete